MKNKITSEWDVLFYFFFGGREGKIDGYLCWRWRKERRIPTVQKFMCAFYAVWNSHWKFNTQTATWISAVKWPKWKYREKPNHNNNKKRMLEQKNEHGQREPNDNSGKYMASPQLSIFSLSTVTSFANYWWPTTVFVEWSANKQPNTHSRTHTHWAESSLGLCEVQMNFSLTLCDKLGELSATKLH